MPPRTTVRTHQRTTRNGGKTTVRQHKRRYGPSAGHAFGLATRSYKAGRKKRRVIAGFLLLAAVAEFITWISFSITALAMAAVATVLIALAVVLSGRTPR